MAALFNRTSIIKVVVQAFEELGRLADKPKILCIGDPSSRDNAAIESLEASNYEVVECANSEEALPLLLNQQFDGVLIRPIDEQSQKRIGALLQNDVILDSMPDGLVLLDESYNIVWANDWVTKCTNCNDVVGGNFYNVFRSEETVGSDLCPFGSAIASRMPRYATLRCDDSLYLQVHAVPVDNSSGDLPAALIVTIRDVSTETLHRQKLAAIHKAGVELADLTTEEVFNMEVEDRIELLKSNIIHFTQDLLNYDVVEIRLLGSESGELMPLLSLGLIEEAAFRPLHASPEGNGVTGFVASTAKSYLCEDTTKDPLYLEGSEGAKSSMTVPLIQHDTVIGTFNVESPEPHAFTQDDLQFLEIFSRDVAAALNTLELLVAQQANTAQASVEAIHREVALPVDEILNDAVNVMEGYIGHEPGVVKRLQRILQNARDIKQLIHKVGQELAPAEAVPQFAQVPERQLLRMCKILVVDADESVRGAAHSLLERFGCIVETAHEGGEAVFMVRNVGNEQGYDVIIADINLPDMTGYELLLKLKDIIDPTPLVLMKGFGYDPGHAMVKARQAGLHPKAVLYKPFRMDQLLEVCETVIKAYGHPAPSKS